MTDFAQALREAEAWLDLEGVEGVAEGKAEGRPCITVFVSRKEAAEKIPKTLHGQKVVIEFTDEFRALAE